jgi:short-subunit dehydrogenase
MPHWQDKIVLVTGASRGLGRVIAETFAESGAKLVLAARGEEALNRAAAELREAGHEVIAVPTDVTETDQVTTLIERTVEHYGGLDVLVNNVGRSARGELARTPPAEVREMFELNVMSVIGCTQTALPHLLKSRGHVVNIGSLASRVAPRYLGAYALSKFPLAAYSQQLRLELGREGLHVLLVCPGPIAGDDRTRYAGENLDGLPKSAAKPGGGANISLLRPEKVAREILTACEKRRPELVLPRKARILFALSAISPRLGDWLLCRSMSSDPKNPE